MDFCKTMFTENYEYSALGNKCSKMRLERLWTGENYWIKTLHESNNCPGINENVRIVTYE